MSNEKRDIKLHVFSSLLTLWIVGATVGGGCQYRDSSCGITDELILAVYGNAVVAGFGILVFLGAKLIGNKSYNRYAAAGAAIGFLGVNAALAVGGALAYAAHGESYTMRNINAGAFILGAMAWAASWTHGFCSSSSQEGTSLLERGDDEELGGGAVSSMGQTQG